MLNDVEKAILKQKWDAWANKFPIAAAIVSSNIKEHEHPDLWNRKVDRIKLILKEPNNSLIISTSK